jgi:HTH-type transcriptional regulator/antitoxin HigA
MSRKTYTLHPIRTDADYRAALKQVAPYFDREPEPDSEAGAHFEALLVLIEAWEAKHYPMDPPDPVEAIKFRMEQMGLTPRDLEPMIGGRGRVSEVLNRKRSLSLSMVRRLHEGLDIPAETLIRESSG